MEHFWSFASPQLIKTLKTPPQGLSSDEAENRLKEQSGKIVHRKAFTKDILLLLSQYKSPLVLLLAFAVLLSSILGEYSQSIIILIVLILTGATGFWQERNAGRAVEKLRLLVYNKAMVKRSGKEFEVLASEVVQGDIIVLNSGDIIPADGIILEANELHVNEAILTGESFPIAKFAGAVPADTPMSQATNALFKGTSVLSGYALMLSVNTNEDTILGKIGFSLQKPDAPTAFEKGISKFGYMLMYLTILISIAILIINLVLRRPLFDSILFALALAVGLTPELLPAIITITLSKGAKRMAQKKVIVKKLAAIQNMGEIDILCSDKTGTLTEGIVKVAGSSDSEGNDYEKILTYAYLNARFQTSFSNPLDDIILASLQKESSQYEKTGEVPYDFNRKRLTVFLKYENRQLIITKGAVKEVSAICTWIQNAKGEKNPLDEAHKKAITERFEQISRQGFRAIAVAAREQEDFVQANQTEEKAMTFLGFLLLSDSPKEGIHASIERLQSQGIELKMITGDNQYAALHLAEQIGMNASRIVTGAEIDSMTDDLLRIAVRTTNVFAEVVPEHKEKIVHALQQTGHVVGFMGDGINDANALKAADVGISVESAVDVAKEAADIVLLDREVNVVCDGILEGRKTFMNTMKYICVVTSSNFGNMISMSVASVFLPFLPLLPVQILLNNFLSDIPSIAISSDHVDTELTTKPRRWDMKNIRRFMIVFGLESSLFDFITFGLLFYYFHTNEDHFRSGWFMESLLSQIVILLVLRTRHRFYKSRPSNYLLAASGATFLACLAIPYLPIAHFFELYPLPADVFAAIVIVIFVYILFAEATKKFSMKNF